MTTPEPAPERVAKGFWWDRAWSLVEGCTPDDRHFNGTVRVREDLLGLPWGIEKPTVWAVWTDLFHEDVPLHFILDAFYRMKEATHHQFMVLTKRASNMCDTITNTVIGEGIVPNIWLGVTVEDQKTADERIPHLLATPAAKRFISYEPALGPVDFTKWFPPVKECDYYSSFITQVDRAEGIIDCARPENPFGKCSYKNCIFGWPFINLVIMGGESGSKARPMNPDWARSVRDQCAAAGVAFWFKQWGEWCPRESHFYPTEVYGSQGKRIIPAHVFTDGSFMDKIGKKHAGRLLDGVEHNGWPE